MVHRAHRRRAVFDALLGDTQPAPILGKRRGGGEHLGRGTGGVGGAVTQAARHRGRCRGEALTLGCAFGFGQIAAGLEVDGRQRAGTDHRGVLHAGDDRDTVLNGAGLRR